MQINLKELRVVTVHAKKNRTNISQAMFTQRTITPCSPGYLRNEDSNNDEWINVLCVIFLPY